MWLLARISAFSALGGFLFGYDLGLIGGALLDLSHDLNITTDLAKETIVGAAKFGAFFGTFVGGAAMLRWGRKRAIAFNSVFFVLGPLIMSSSWNAGGLIVGRLVLGLGIGASALVVPAYLGELAPAGKRGAVVTVYEMMLCVGMLTASFVNVGLQSAPHNWRWMVGVPALPGAAMALSLLVLPESPRWLVMRGRLAEALDMLHYVMSDGAAPKGGGGGGGGGAECGTQQQQQVGACTAEMAAAEDELLMLWSAVEKDKNWSRERREQLRAPRPPPHGSGVKLPPSQQQQQQQQHKPPLARNNSNFLPAPLLSAGVSYSCGSGSIPLSFCVTSPGGPQAAAVPAAGGWKGEQPSLQEESSSASAWVTAAGAGSGADSAKPAASDAPAAGTTSVRESVDGSVLAGDCDGQQLLPASLQRSSAPTDAEGAATQPSSRGGDGQEVEAGCERTFAHTLGAMLQDIYFVARGHESRALYIALWLAFFDQANASTAIINFAPTVLHRVGRSMSNRDAILYSSAVNVTKAFGVAIGMCLIDRVGRRPLLIWGGVGCAVSMAAATWAVASGSVGWVLATMCAFILAFSVSWAGGYWVLVSELFSMSAKSPASSAATSLLFLSGSATNFVFLSLTSALGPYTFLIFAGVSLLSSAYVARALPETRGRSLLQIQALLAPPGQKQSVVG